jgi:hypothetical protein
MPELIGKVHYLKVGETTCWAKVLKEDTDLPELCPIWTSMTGATATLLASRTMQFELLRTAMETGKRVSIEWNSDTGLPYNVKLLDDTE